MRLIRATTPVLAALLAPAIALAAGSEDPTPPKPTETTELCEEGMVWNPDTELCETIKESRLGDDALYDAARELAYAGRLSDAALALDAMAEAGTDRVLTYRGFVTRKQGDYSGGMAYYRQALDQNPDNLLARSYMGQALFGAGELVAAKAQLAEIIANGGAGGWPANALKSALEGGDSYSY